MLLLVLVLGGCENREVGVFNFPDGAVQHVVRGDSIDWQPCPPSLPENCGIAVLEGNPQGADLFTVRFRVDGEFHLPAHTHPKDERVTVIAGQVSVAFGADGSRQTATNFGPGDYYVNARDAIHSVYVDEMAVLQITGIGPWEVHVVE